MKTSLILRTNKHGAMPDAIMEIEYFKFTSEADILALGRNFSSKNNSNSSRVSE